MVRLLAVVSDFCAWSGMRIKREKSVTTGFDFKNHSSLPTEGILFDGAPLAGLEADAAFAYLGVRASLVSPSRSPVRAGERRRRRCRAPCLAAEKIHIHSAAQDVVGTSVNRGVLNLSKFSLNLSKLWGVLNLSKFCLNFF